MSLLFSSLDWSREDKSTSKSFRQALLAAAIGQVDRVFMAPSLGPKLVFRFWSYML